MVLKHFLLLVSLHTVLASFVSHISFMQTVYVLGIKCVHASIVAF